MRHVSRLNSKKILESQGWKGRRRDLAQSLQFKKRSGPAEAAQCTRGRGRFKAQLSSSLAPHPRRREACPVWRGAIETLRPPPSRLLRGQWCHSLALSTAWDRRLREVFSLPGLAAWSWPPEGPGPPIASSHAGLTG